MILLTRDCEYDKPSRTVLVAEVRPFQDLDAGSQGNIRARRTINAFYLEQRGGILEESYVDFRRMERVSKDLCCSSPLRIASLNDVARLALQRQIALFFGYDVQTAGSRP